MFHSGDAPFAVPALSLGRWREWLCAGSLLLLAAGAWGLGAARSQGLGEPSRPAMDRTIGAPAVEKSALAGSGSSQPAGVSTKSPRPREDRRRILMLLLMNGAGSAVPFGGLGR